MPNLAELEERLQTGGHKLTKSRRLLLEGLLSIEGWASAQELFQYVKARHGRVNFSTIYRNLELLTATGMLCRVEVDTALHHFSLNTLARHHHHLVCKSCRGIWTLDYCPLSNLHTQELRSFSDLECKFDVYGYCPECQAKNLGKPSRSLSPDSCSQAL